MILLKRGMIWKLLQNNFEPINVHAKNMFDVQNRFSSLVARADGDGHTDRHILKINFEMTRVIQNGCFHPRLKIDFRTITVLALYPRISGKIKSLKTCCGGQD